MKNLSLKWKIILVGILPLLCFLGIALYGLSLNLSSYQEAENLNSKMEVLTAASEVVHESQKERGKSAAFLGGGIKFRDLKDQREINTKKIENLKVILLTSSFSESFKEEIRTELEKINPLRKGIEREEIQLSQALKSYSSIIKSLLNIQNYVSRTTSIPSVSSSLRALRILEESKESGGKLRANMSAILAKNKPISDVKFSSIVALKAGLDEGLSSNGLVLDARSKQYIKEFNQAKEWKTVNSTFQLILKNSDKGGYYQDSKEFFNIITTSLNTLGDLINYQKDLIAKSIVTLQNKSFETLWQISLLTLLLFVGVFSFMFKVSNSTSKTILTISNLIMDRTYQVADSSDTMASVSAQLSEAATEQASSLQETVSSIDEISSMVQRNADSASASTEVSKRSNETAVVGKQKIVHMITAINEISDSNNQIMKEMDVNNKEINRIVQVISEIGEKTKVINDIVFQTKLLSFNASVEAARAGEHGKGFAVVAEEVGNLAAMSGKAALEITEMLDSSIKQVKSIVENSKTKIDNLVENGKEKVESGKQIAGECGDALDEILQNVTSVNEMVREISTASTEQSTGVREVTTAMQQLDEVAHQNTSSANESSSIAKGLKEHAKGLDFAVKDLIQVVNGRSVKTDKKEKEHGHKPTHDDSNIVAFTPRKEQAIQTQKTNSLKVSGLDTTIPDENDSRFEDL
jgi:methyl-accepting chemotaxis protein